jgi:hypothetical protein
MSCEEADYLLDIHLDGELDLGRQVELEQHLSQCLSCQLILRERQEFRTLRVSILHQYPSVPGSRSEEMGPELLNCSEQPRLRRALPRYLSRHVMMSWALATKWHRIIFCFLTMEELLK